MRYLCITILLLGVLSPKLLYSYNGSNNENKLLKSESSGWFSDAAIAAADSRAKDEEALVALYNATNGDNWDNRRGWNGASMSLDDDIFGVEVEKIDGELRVVLIRLNNNGSGDPKNNPLDNQGNNLTGSLPNELGNLKELRHFNVSSNNLTGNLPGGMRYCSKIERAIFELTTSDAPGAYNYHDWNEPISPHQEPLSGESGKQRGFDKWPHNNFTGSLPGEWSDWNAIEMLAVASTTIDDNGRATIEGITGKLPPEWGNMTTLQQLFLDINELSGKLPPEWASMVELVDLYLNVNQLGSAIEGHEDAVLPSAWGGGEGYGGGMRKLRHLSVNDRINGGDYSDYFGGGVVVMRWDGPIPENWGNLQMLHRFTMPMLNQQHPFPEFFSTGKWKDRVVSSNPNPDADPIEAWAVRLTEIKQINNMTSMPDFSNLDLSRFAAAGNNNNFGGQQVPSSLSTQTGMKQLFLAGVNITGPFPDVTGWNKCKIFEIRDNNIGGNLPEVPGSSGSEWRNVQMQNSGFIGQIPSSWGALPDQTWTRLWLHDNMLSGAIPAGLADNAYGEDDFRIDNNSYVFADIIPVLNSLPNPSDLRYAPQRRFGSAQTRYLSEGESISIDDFSGVVTHSGNRYRWQKDGADISGATSRTLSISSFSAADEGTYTLVVTNPGAPDLTLTSHEITLTIGDGSNNDGDGNETQKISAPVQLSPNDGAINTSQTPMFEWEPVDGADYYILHGNRINPGEMKIDVEVQGTSYKVQDYLDPETTHHWRVRAVKDGVEGEWSPIWEFKTKEAPTSVPGVPELGSPGDGAKDIGLNPTLNWASASEAESYQLQLSKEKNFGSTVVDSSGITDTSAEVEGLTYASTYYWRLRAENSVGESNWSQIRSFTTEPEKSVSVSKPELNFPADNTGSVSLTPILRWNSAGADHYILNVRKSETSELVIESEVLGTKHSISEELDPETTYSWRVRAVKGGVNGEWSAEWKFTTGQGDKMETVLEQNYPNPFNPSTQIRFNLGETQDVSLKVYDTVGRLVATLVEGTLTAGTYERSFRADNLASGVYFIRLITKNRVFTSQMTLMK